MADSPMRFKEATASLFVVACFCLGANIFPNAYPWVRVYLGVSTFFTVCYVLTDCFNKRHRIRWKDIIRWPAAGCLTAAGVIAMLLLAALIWGFVREHSDVISTILLVPVYLVLLAMLIFWVRGKFNRIRNK